MFFLTDLKREWHIHRRLYSRFEIEPCGRFSVLKSSGFELARLKFKLGIKFREKFSVARIDVA